MALNRRLPQTTPLHGHRLVFAWPGRRGVAEEPQRAIGPGAELEPPASADDQDVTGGHIYRWSEFRVGVWMAAPDISISFKHVPDFFDSAVPDRPSYLSGTQCNLDQTAFIRVLT